MEEPEFCRSQDAVQRNETLGEGFLSILIYAVKINETLGRRITFEASYLSLYKVEPDNSMRRKNSE